jgi:hypothetical protein
LELISGVTVERAPNVNVRALALPVPPAVAASTSSTTEARSGRTTGRTVAVRCAVRA